MKGLDTFKAHFAGAEHQYVLIGGAACDIVLSEVGLDARLTKDLDIVLCIEAVDNAFFERLWRFIEAGGYTAARAALASAPARARPNAAFLASRLALLLIGSAAAAVTSLRMLYDERLSEKRLTGASWRVLALSLSRRWSHSDETGGDACDDPPRRRADDRSLGGRRLC